MQERLPRRLEVVFGLTVVTAFGCWFYGYGVLVPLLTADGLSEQVVSTTYGVGLFGAGVVALLAGRWSDRHGARGLFLVGGAVVAVGTAVVVTASGPLVFGVAAVATGTAIGGLGYYSLVHATIAHLVPGDRARAITVNTLWGAFASPVYLPVMGWLSSSWSWEATMAVANTPVVVAFVACGLVLATVDESAPPRSAASVDEPVAAGDDTTTSPGQPVGDRRVGAGVAAVGEAAGGDQRPAGPGRPVRGGQPAGRSLLSTALAWLRGPLPGLVAVAALTGATTSVLLLYQVPAMVEAGLALTLASTLAGARGLLQLAGRLPLPPVIRRFGSGRTFVGSLGLLVVAALVLPVTGHIAVALLFVVVGGVAIGAMTTVESIFATDVVGTHDVGTSLGAMSLTRGIGGAIGPTAAGVVTVTTGSRTPSLVGIAVLAVVTAAVVAVVDRRHAARAD